MFRKTAGKNFDLYTFTMADSIARKLLPVGLRGGGVLKSRADESVKDLCSVKDSTRIQVFNKFVYATVLAWIQDADFINLDGRRRSSLQALECPREKR